MKLTPQRIRDSKMLLAILALIKEHDGSMRYKEIKEEFPKYYPLPPEELQPKGTRTQAWHALLQMVGGIELKAAGIVDIQKGVWSLTKEGEAAISLSPEDFYKLYHSRWKEYNRKRQEAKALAGQPIESLPPDDEAIEEAAATDVETLQQTARDGIRQYIINKTPYQFQDFVAAILRGMGYHTPYIAKKGKDGGLDIVAYADPLGATGTHIKVQVKHEPTSSISVRVARELSASLNNDNDMGIVATSGSFSEDCKREARAHPKHIRLLEMEDLIDLWLQVYPNLSADDKAIVPLVPIYHLNNDKI